MWNGSRHHAWFADAWIVFFAPPKSSKVRGASDGLTAEDVVRQISHSDLQWDAEAQYEGLRDDRSPRVPPLRNKPSPKSLVAVTLRLD
jgi:hypothetical protein